MSLPKIAKVTFELVVPSSGKKLKYRPFLVKEEKVLILAQESGNQKEMARAIKEVIDACVLSRGFKVDELATFDIEYIFLNIRGRSVGEDVEVIITCPDDGVTKVNHTIFLDEIKVVFDEEHSATVSIDDTYSVKMKYPTMEEVMETDTDNVTVEQSLGLIAGCIDQIYSEEESWAAADSSPEELVAWVEELDPQQFAKLEKFFTTMPKLTHTINVINPETGVNNEIVLEGLGSFFRISMAHENLESYYKTNFALMQHHKYSLSEIEDMIPWEREIYIMLLKNWIEEEEERIKSQNTGSSF